MPGGTSKEPSPFIKELAALLREKAAREGLRHPQIADAVHISRPQVSKILAGQKQIELDLLDQLCWALGLSMRDVVIAADKATEFRHTSSSWVTPTLTRQ